MVSKKKVIIGIAIAVAIIVAVVATLYVMFPNSPLRNTGISGTYYSTDPHHPGTYIELRSDGTAFLLSKTENGMGGYITSGTAGTWELRDGARIFLTTDQGAAGYLRIDGNNLTDEQQGEVFAKR
jgi:hypothetical protein